MVSSSDFPANIQQQVSQLFKPDLTDDGASEAALSLSSDLKTQKLFRDTLGRNLTEYEARDCERNIAGFFRVLLEWQSTEQPRANLPSDKGDHK
jgi:hypothetical protein